MIDVSVVIVNYNTKKLTLECLNSIVNLTKNVNYEIIVVDNSSIDGSQDEISKAFPDVRLICLNENIGFGRANNKGVEIAEGEYVFFLNSDTLLLNNSIQIFSNFFKNYSNTKYACAGSLLLNLSRDFTHSSNKFPTPFFILKTLVLGYLNKISAIDLVFENFDFGDSSHFEVDYITGADLFISKEKFNKIGGFDSNFFMYFEETDLQKRLSNAGFQSIVIKGPEIIHLEGGSSEAVSLKKKKIIALSMFIYLKKHNRYLDYIIFRAFYFLLRIPIILNFKAPIKERLSYAKLLLKAI
jgi:GT2 family glycosyltransferase